MIVGVWGLLWFFPFRVFHKTSGALSIIVCVCMCIHPHPIFVFDSRKVFLDSVVVEQYSAYFSLDPNVECIGPDGGRQHQECRRLREELNPIKLALFWGTRKGINWHCDSYNAILLWRNSAFHSKSKFINVGYHWIWDVLEQKNLHIEKAHIDENGSTMMCLKA